MEKKSLFPIILAIIGVCLIGTLISSIDFIVLDVYTDIAAKNPIPEFYNRLGIIAEGIMTLIISTFAILFGRR